MVKTVVIAVCLQAALLCGAAQRPATDSPAIDRKKAAIVTGGNLLFLAGSYVALDKAWYSQYPRTDFHFFNDNAEWLQMDKYGHVWSTYQLSRASAECWSWPGLNRRSAVLLGSATAMLYQTVIEIHDGFAPKWGFSWGDMLANVAGAGLYAGQELCWGGQRLQFKMSYLPVKYDADLSGRSNALFGSSPAERVLKDYNGQTYWLSANLKSFFPDSRLPSWLNISVGYGASGMLGGRSNSWTIPEGQVVERHDIPREARLYLAPDIDLTRIHTSHKWLRTVFFLFNSIKVPAPALELRSGRLSAHAVKF